MASANAASAALPEVLGKLPQLQNMVKRDPEAYKAEFLMQWRHYESEYQLFELQPSKQAEHFGAIVSFLSHVAKCYPTEMKEFPQQIVNLLRTHALVLEPHLRRTLVQALMLMRNRGLIDPITLLKLFFELFRCPDNRLRDLLYKHIISDLRQLNTNSKNMRVNRALQNFMFEMLQDESEHAAIRSLQVMIELFKRKIWHDEHTANVIVTACVSKNTKLMVTSLSFFLGIDADILEEEEKIKQEKTQTAKVDYHEHSKKTKKRYRDTLTTLKKNKRARKREVEFAATFPAIELLHDPLGAAEKQLKVLKGCTERFEVKLLMMNFIGRVLGFHRLVLLPFFSLLQRYLQSHQQNVTQILAYLVQACHEDVPPDELLPIVKSIANNFVVDRCSAEVMAVGVNALREIFRRVPLVLECEGMDALIEDLIMYNRSRDKTVVIAARGVLNLIRDVHPALLKRKDRGKFHDVTARPKRFGELVAAEGVDGADLLEEAEKSGRFDEEDNGDGWEVASSESEEESEDGWVDVSSDDDDEDEDPEDEKQKKQKKGKTSRKGKKSDDSEMPSADEQGSEEEEEEEIEVEEEEEEDDDEDNNDENEDADDDEDAEEDEEEDVDHSDGDEENDGEEENDGDGDNKMTDASEKNKPAAIDTSKAKKSQAERLEARRILTPKDFERIEQLKKEREATKKDPSLRRKRKAEQAADAKEGSIENRVNPEDLEGFAKKKRMTQEERLRQVLEGREDWKPKQKGGGTTNTEKKRLKHYMMIKKSRQVQAKMLRGTRDVQRKRTQKVKKILKHDAKKRRTL